MRSDFSFKLLFTYTPPEECITRLGTDGLRVSGADENRVQPVARILLAHEVEHLVGLVGVLWVFRDFTQVPELHLFDCDPQITSKNRGNITISGSS